MIDYSVIMTSQIQFGRMPVLWMMIEINITEWMFYGIILVK